MNSAVQNILRSVVEKFGLELVKSPRLCDAYLSDLMPAYPKERVMLVKAVAEGIPAQLLQNSSPQSHTSAVVRLSRNAMLPEAEANKVVYAWSYALSKELQRVTHSRDRQARRQYLGGVITGLLVLGVSSAIAVYRVPPPPVEVDTSQNVLKEHVKENLILDSLEEGEGLPLMPSRALPEHDIEEQMENILVFPRVDELTLQEQRAHVLQAFQKQHAMDASVLDGSLDEMSAEFSEQLAKAHQQWVDHKERGRKTAVFEAAKQLRLSAEVEAKRILALAERMVERRKLRDQQVAEHEAQRMLALQKRTDVRRQRAFELEQQRLAQEALQAQILADKQAEEERVRLEQQRKEAERRQQEKQQREQQEAERVKQHLAQQKAEALKQQEAAARAKAEALKKQEEAARTAELQRQQAIARKMAELEQQKQAARKAANLERQKQVARRAAELERQRAQEQSAVLERQKLAAARQQAEQRRRQQALARQRAQAQQAAQQRQAKLARQQQLQKQKQQQPQQAAVSQSKNLHKAQTIVRQLIGDSVAFGQNAANLTKKQADLAVVNRLFKLTKETFYQQQQQQVQGRIYSLRQKQDVLSGRYIRRLRQLCSLPAAGMQGGLRSLAPTYKGKKGMEAVAFRVLTQHAGRCVQVKRLEDNSLARELASAYGRVLSR